MFNFSPQLFTPQYSGTLVILQELLANPRSILPEMLLLSPQRVSLALLAIAWGEGTQQSRLLLFSLGLPCHVPAMLLSAVARALAALGSDVLRGDGFEQEGLR